jgi:hypothetical protein
MKMTFPTNDEFVNRELSIDELEAIAAGGVWGWIKSEANSALNWIEGPGLKIAGEIIRALEGHPGGPKQGGPVQKLP